ncbi:hypothetical protein O181_088033 [Austropuccinia psidii MF-1]|uniref:Uncharacterized protein n=1 Tax=Austropuccinia psidii MF-1 TaxID=1389203 RepID=A0A9Q3IQT6_9BASI|nr:hypothetical protein [Austropuccinia psidii MF-1]
MSRDDYVKLNSYANIIISSKFSLKDKNTSGIPLSNPSQQPQQASTLSWCSGAHHSREGGTVTTTSSTLLLHGCSYPTWSQVGANWSHHYIYGQVAPLGVLWLLRHNPFEWPFMTSGHILPSLAFLANFHLTNPQAFIFDFGPGRATYGSYGPYSPWAMIDGPRCVGCSPGGPPSPQGQVGPKPHLDPPEPKLVTNSLDPKLAKDPQDTNLAINCIGPIFGHGPPWTNISAMSYGNHQRPPDQLSQPSP